ncbi:MAG: 50S ribosomal protein L24 [Candidatus Buchananbacteria bacterium CG10_big_fil_rev_8_21_14_0_10_42_9]|uniref:Large ribosomal subunit protein uL24 n=1 Tax=Candidatus Buchananbacteria bacterium CG10_big_fil_rev_8_21_14_0_10_42_9 TaxID=1974526 RepID=A0A2H0W225_9BACT|nr:MAG: 50S ribosomal protein L24 [Candidatus Buchananbacteria bacterium CG10_big_fil_rev_8_21_14_0_10_42_9]
MKIKKGDKVKVLAGKDKGKTGKVLQVLPKYNKASVEGVNIAVKHLRSQKRGEAGQKIEYPAPIHISSLALISPVSGKTVRVGYKKLENGKMVRRDTKTNETFE